jgi:4-hydroxybenzoate polyprenyltransferase
MIRALVLTSRPLSWVNTAFPFAAAYLLTTREVDATLIVGTLFFLVPYNLAMYGINDVFDYASDLRNPRKGGVEGALLDPRWHRTVLWLSGILALPFVAYLVIVGDPASWAALAVSLFAVVAYSAAGLRFKERPGLDSLTSSTHFASPAVYALLLAGATWTPALFALLAAFFLWGAASHAFGAVQDVVADRAGGIASIATVIGARRTVRLAVALYLLAGILLLALPWPGLIAAAFALPYVVNALPWWRVNDETAPTAHRGWRRFLWLNFATGFGVTMLLIAYAILEPAAS